jgi:hypothetical protein
MIFKRRLTMMSQSSSAVILCFGKQIQARQGAWMKQVTVLLIVLLQSHSRVKKSKRLTFFGQHNE